MDEQSVGQGDPAPGAARGAGKPIIAVFNSSYDTVELLRTALDEQWATFRK